MQKRITLVAIPVIAIALLLFQNCSAPIGPVAKGTETGNPESPQTAVSQLIDGLCAKLSTCNPSYATNCETQLATLPGLAAQLGAADSSSSLASVISNTSTTVSPTTVSSESLATCLDGIQTSSCSGSGYASPMIGSSPALGSEATSIISQTSACGQVF